jgi:hypothetical protein
LSRFFEFQKLSFKKVFGGVWGEAPTSLSSKAKGIARWAIPFLLLSCTAVKIFV